jgi:hypothetical protein
MIFRNVALLALLFARVSAKKDGPFATYTADIVALNDGGPTATVVVFAGYDGGLIGYGGFATGLEIDLEAEDVSHIHRAGVSIVKLIDSIDVYLNDLVLVLFSSSPCFSALQ